MDHSNVSTEATKVADLTIDEFRELVQEVVIQTGIVLILVEIVEASM